MPVILLGYRGSGKSTLAAALAGRLGCHSIDTDGLIIRAAGMPIAELFARHGESHFRDLEERALAEALADSQAIISTGGGIVLREGNRARLSVDPRLKVYLACEPGELARRLSSDPGTALHRPSLTGTASAVDEIQNVLARREPLYRQTADLTLDVTHAPVDTLVDKIAEVLKARR